MESKAYSNGYEDGYEGTMNHNDYLSEEEGVAYEKGYAAGVRAYWADQARPS